MENYSRKTSLACCAVLLAAFSFFPTLVAAANSATPTWTQLSPATAPPARDVSGMAYDGASQKIVMFGGYDGSYLNDTWMFDGTNWTQVVTSAAPSPRTSAMLAYDAPSRKLILFGGYNGSEFLGDTWVFDGVALTWTQVQPANSPKPMAGAMLFTDPKNLRADLYGGFDGNFYQLDTWQWTNGNWQLLQTSNAPYARAWGVVATDRKRAITVVSGGLGDVRTDNTWTWNGSKWSLRNPVTALPRLFNVTADYDPAFGVVVVFGGDDGNGAMNTSWAWIGTNWLLGQPSQSPPARESHGMAYDYASRQLIVFGGDDGVNYLGDTWSLVQQ